MKINIGKAIQTEWLHPIKKLPRKILHGETLAEAWERELEEDQVSK